mmetsp:Transcript_35926/g.26683  ORF Transcript_35926/g.26683 Transcript_35926/m.26683 type:complete len:116 (-) Transcript_35926:178-525(-)
MLSRIIDITMLSHLVPLFAVLSALNIYTSYYSAKVIDEIHLSPQRANILLQEYFSCENGEAAPLLSVPEVNHSEAFYLPNLFNSKYCRFIRYGQSNVGKVVAKKSKTFLQESILN